jgi:ribosomal protein S27AE
LPDQPSEDAITDDRSVFAKWPTCPHCAIRMVMASEDAQRYAFMCIDCHYRTTRPKT